MKCRLLLFLALFAISHSSFAQNFDTKDYQNTFQVSSCFLRVPNTIFEGHEWPTDELGITYLRKVYRNFGVEASYSAWNKLNADKEVSGSSNYLLKVQQSSTVPIQVGTLYSREAYHFAELGINYRISVSSRFSILPKFGYTYCWGINNVFSWIYQNPVPPYDMMSDVSSTKITYQGFYGGITLDYNFWHQRINTGLEFKYRNMSNSFSERVLGVHAGFSF